MRKTIHVIIRNPFSGTRISIEIEEGLNKTHMEKRFRDKDKESIEGAAGFEMTKKSLHVLC